MSKIRCRTKGRIHHHVFDPLCRAEQGMAASGDSLSNGLATQELEIELHHLRGEYVRLLKTTEELRKNLTDMRAQVSSQ